MGGVIQIKNIIILYEYTENTTLEDFIILSWCGE